MSAHRDKEETAIVGTVEAWRQILNDLAMCASCDWPATVERGDAFYCDRHGGASATETLTAPIIRAIALRTGAAS